MIEHFSGVISSKQEGLGGDLLCGWLFQLTVGPNCGIQEMKIVLIVDSQGFMMEMLFETWTKNTCYLKQTMFGLEDVLVVQNGTELCWNFNMFFVFNNWCQGQSLDFL